MLWGWVQETGRPAGDHPSACCLSLPRLLWQHPLLPGRLWQEPLPELADLRQPGHSWALEQPQMLVPGQPLSLPAARGEGYLEIEVRA